METLTVFLAQFIGIFSLVLGLSTILKKKMVISIFDDIFKNRQATYLLGFAELFAGLTVVLNHNIWEGTLPLIVTAIGWLLLIEGFIYIFASKKSLINIWAWVHRENVYHVFSVIYIVVGVYLIHFGFDVF